MHALEETTGIPLAVADIGRNLVLKCVRADMNLKAHLTAMGLCPGTELKLLSRSPNGPCILVVKESRVALDWGMAYRILVA